MLSVLAALALAGCSLGSVVSQQALDYNAAIETAANSQLLRNILRARDSQPLHFSSVPQVRGALGTGVSLGGAAPIGTQPQNAALVLPQGFFTSQPSFDVAALDTQEFARGIQQPVEPEVVQFMLDRGLPQQMVLYLLIARVHELDGRTVTNDPRFRPVGEHNVVSAEECRGRGGARFREGCDAFQIWVERRTAGRRLFFNSYVRLVPVSGPLSPAQAGDGNLLAAMQNPGLVVRRVHGQLRVWRPLPQFVLCSEPTRGPQSAADAAALGIPIQPNEPPRFEAAVQATRSAQQSLEDGASPDSLCQLREVYAADTGPAPDGRRVPGVQIRSVQEVFGFLGELLRRPGGGEDFRILVPLRVDATGRRPEPCIPGTALACPALLRLRADSAEGSWLSLAHDGQRYHVGRFDEARDQTSRVLAVLDLLLNLHKSAGAIPTTRAVQTLR